jgi:hypothetical protein
LTLVRFSLFELDAVWARVITPATFNPNEGQEVVMANTALARGPAEAPSSPFARHADNDAHRRFDSGVVPRNVVRPEALSFHVLSPANPGPADYALLGEAYNCWSNVWKTTLFELDKAEHVPSDEFTRQDEIGALFHDWECVGLMGYRTVDLASAMHRDDSYFRVWTEEARARATAKGTRMFIAGNLTVAVPWRRADGASVKELLLALAIERFKASGADALLGTTRNDRGMNDLGYRLGFGPLVRNVTLHNVAVDLVAFFQDTERTRLDASTETTLDRLIHQHFGTTP